jgi:gluconate:H+ symporter, GntP family
VITEPSALLWIATLGVVLVVLLITWVRMPAFLALATGSLVVGLAAKMPLANIPRAFQAGVGDTLGFVAMVIGLGTIIGKLLAESGGATVVSDAIIRAMGVRRLDWAMMLSGFVIGLPVFFQVGLVLLAPVMFTVAQSTGTPLLRLGLPLVAGLSTAHGLVPPHPGPVAALVQLHADAGRTLIYSLIVGFPTAIIAGPLFARFATARVSSEPGTMAAQLAGRTTSGRPPGLGITLLTILMPVALMLAAALAQALPAVSTVRAAIEFAGTPLMAMLLSTLLALVTFGTACGFDRGRILQFAEEALPPIASVLLVVGAGGGFARVLDLAGVDTAIAQAMGGKAMSPLVLGWLIASLLRIAVGSATVSVVTAAGIMAPIAAAMPDVNRELLVVAIGAGSLIAGHVNDGGFWLVKEYLNTTVAQTLATWTPLETVVAVCGLAGTLLLALVV